MKVLYFHQHFSTPKGAAGLRSYQMATALSRNGHEVTVVCGSYGAAHTGLTSEFRKGRREGKVDGLHIIEFELPYSNRDGFLKRTWIFIKFAFKSIGVALFRPADIVFATSTPLTAALPGIFAKLFRRRKFVFEVRDLWPELPKAMGVIRNPLILWAMSVLEWLSYRLADRCIGLSPGIVEGIRKRSPAGRKIDMIPNGSNLELFDPDNSEAWRPAQVSDQDFLAVFAGTHGIANGLDSVLDAAGELVKRDENGLKIILIGDGKLKPHLVERATREGLSNVVFLDPVPKSKLAGLFKAADVGLMVLDNVPEFYYGTSPNKFFDYIAAGLPVVNNYPGWLADMIKKYECGWVVKPGVPTEFADTLLTARNTQPELGRLGGNARYLASEEFDWKRLERKFVDTIVASCKEASSQ